MRSLERLNASLEVVQASLEAVHPPSQGVQHRVGVGLVRVQRGQQIVQLGLGRQCGDLDTQLGDPRLEVSESGHQELSTMVTSIPKPSRKGGQPAWNGE